MHTYIHTDIYIYIYINTYRYIYIYTHCYFYYVLLFTYIYIFTFKYRSKTGKVSKLQLSFRGPAFSGHRGGAVPLPGPGREPEAMQDAPGWWDPLGKYQRYILYIYPIYM